MRIRFGLSIRNLSFFHKKFSLRHAGILLVLVLGVSFQAFGQEATIVGTVTDPSGSVIANAKITARNAETGLVHTITTNEAGQYVLPDLHIGHYDVKVEATGFKAAEQKGIVLQVGDRARLDFQMQVGGASETVTVEAAPIRVQTDTGEVSNVITDLQVSQIAVNGRSIYQLAALAPGASSQINNYVNTPVGGDANVEFNGVRQNHNIYLLDGGEDDDRGGAGGMSIAPASDANFGTSAITVPTQAQVASSVLFRNCPGGVAPANITQGQPFPNNTIPSCMIDPNAGALLTAGIFPKPTNGNKFFGSANVPTSLKEEIVRIDHNFTSKFSVFGHFVAEQVSQGFSNSQWSGDNVPTVGDTFGNPSYSGVIHTTYTINPTLINEVAFNYNGNRINIIPFAAQGLKSLSLPSGYDSTTSRLFSGPNNLTRIPNISLDGQSGANFQISSWPWKNKADDYQIRDDVSWAKGAHQFRFGGSWAIYKKVQDLFGTTQGAFSFSGKAPSYTGDSFADYLLGLPQSYQELGVQDHGYWNNVSWAAYEI